MADAVSLCLLIGNSCAVNSFQQPNDFLTVQIRWIHTPFSMALGKGNFQVNRDRMLFELVNDNLVVVIFLPAQCLEHKADASLFHPDIEIPFPILPIG